MARRKHYWGRTPLPHDGGPKLWRMILFLFILGLMYTQMRQASNWAWLARSAQAQESPRTEKAAGNPAPEGAPQTGDAPPATTAPAVQPWEKIVAGPTDKEEWEERRIQDSLEVVTDKTTIQDADMPAYWNLMRWARAQSAADLAARAQPGITMNDLWQGPKKLRGKIARIPLHIRQIKKFEAEGENSAGLKTGYELWGWSEDSQSLPYVIVVPELPPGMEVGNAVVEEGVFSGYFFKWLWYQPGVGKARSSPMLIGRLQAEPKVVKVTPSLREDPLFGWVVGGVAIVVFGILMWARLSPRRIKPIVTIPKDEAAALSFLEEAFSSKPAPGLPAPPMGLPAPDDESRKPQEAAAGGGG